MKYFGETKKPKYNPKFDYGANFARMIKVDDKKGYAELARLYFVLHSDHESGNVSAHTMHLVGSALSDPYLSFSASLNGLAGPLHGLANQECLGWLLEVHKQFGGVPTRDELYKFAWDTLNSGKVIPGYGHAVLRVPDPRFTAQLDFAKKRFPDDDLVRLESLLAQMDYLEVRSPAVCADCFVYDLSLERGDGRPWSVTLDDMSLDGSGLADLVGFVRTLMDEALKN